jgi:hypothetical protein
MGFEQSENSADVVASQKGLHASRKSVKIADDSTTELGDDWVYEVVEGQVILNRQVFNRALGAASDRIREFEQHWRDCQQPLQ